jgi:hypothetical protein
MIVFCRISIYFWNHLVQQLRNLPARGEQMYMRQIVTGQDSRRSISVVGRFRAIWIVYIYFPPNTENRLDCGCGTSLNSLQSLPWLSKYLASCPHCPLLKFESQRRPNSGGGGPDPGLPFFTSFLWAMRAPETSENILISEQCRVLENEYLDI